MSDRICTNCGGQTAMGCWLCNPEALEGFRVLIHRCSPIYVSPNNKIARVIEHQGRYWVLRYGPGVGHVVHLEARVFSDKAPEVGKWYRLIYTAGPSSGGYHAVLIDASESEQEQDAENERYIAEHFGDCGHPI